MGKCSQYIKWRERKGTVYITGSQSYLNVCLQRKKRREKKYTQKLFMILSGEWDYKRLSSLQFYLLCKISMINMLYT